MMCHMIKWTEIFIDPVDYYSCYNREINQNILHYFSTFSGNLPCFTGILHSHLTAIPQ